MQPLAHADGAIRGGTCCSIEQGAGTEHVWIDGRQVVRDGELLTVDEDAILAEATGNRRPLRGAPRRPRGLHRPATTTRSAACCWDAHASDIGIERLVRLR